MFIVFDHANLASSGGAISECLYVAPPPELVTNLVIKAINIRLLGSRSETIGYNQLYFTQSSFK